MSAFKHKRDRGSLFKNDKKDIETHPDFKGSADIGGEEYYVSMWISAEDSKTEFSLGFTKKQDKPYKAESDAKRDIRQSEPASVQAEIDDGDELPF